MHRKNTHSFYVLSTSFLRNWYYGVWIFAYSAYYLHILHIRGEYLPAKGNTHLAM